MADSGYRPSGPPPHEVIRMTPTLLLVAASALAADPAPPPAPPVLEMGARDGRIEVRWKKQAVSFVATAPRIAVREGGLWLEATRGDMVTIEVSGTRPPRALTVDGKPVAVEPPSPGNKPLDAERFTTAVTIPRAVISLADGTIKFLPPPGGKLVSGEPPIRRGTP
jgi:hypothetical protein